MLSAFSAWNEMHARKGEKKVADTLEEFYAAGVAAVWKSQRREYSVFRRL